MKYVRWKRYGFTHILPENPGRSRWGGPKTLCGNDSRHYNNFRLPTWGPSVTEQAQGLRAGDIDPRLLPPSDKDDGKRPLCGACKKAADKLNRKD
jgi:hypothetical protein